MSILARLWSIGRDKARYTAIQLRSPLLGIDNGDDENADLSEDTEKVAFAPKPSRRRWTPLLLLLAASTTALLVIFGAATGSHARILDKLPSSIKEGWHSVLYSHTSSTSKGLDRSWDYYAQHGVFVGDRLSDTLPLAQRARFVPVSKIEQFAASGETGLNASVKLGDGFDEAVLYSAAVDKENKKALSSLSYLRNKTVLIIGDSIDRFSLDFTCRNMLAKSQLSYRKLHYKPHDLSRVDGQQNGLDEFSEPHRCQLHSSHFGDTTIWSLMLYGVTSGPDEWQHKDMTRQPRQYDAKIRMFAENFAKLGKKPDLIIVNTVLWDLATANLRDARAEVPTQEQLSFAFMEEFREKTIKLLALIDELWPEAAKMYRPNHGMKHTSTGVWFLRGLRPQPKAIERTPYAPNKVIQLNQIVEEILANQTDTERPFWPFDFRHALQDYIADFQDDVHVGSLGRAIYGQMLLYYIKMLT